MFPSSKKRRRSGKLLLIPDPVLLSRLNKYLESKKNEETIDQNRMVEDLRTNYREYEKKDKTAFRASVFRAYNYILEPLINPTSMQDNDNDDHDDLSSIESCSLDEEQIGVDSDDPIDEIEVLDGKSDNPKESNNGNVSYLQNLQNMTNAGIGIDGKSSSKDGDKDKSPVVDAIDISSDDEDERPSKPRNSSSIRQKHIDQYTSRRVNVCNKNKADVPRFPSGISVNPVSISLIPTGHYVRPAVTTTSCSMGAPNQTCSGDTSVIPPSVVSTPQKRKAQTPLFYSIKKKRETILEIPKVKLKDFGGSHKIAQSLNCLLQHMQYPDVYSRLGINPPTGFLLHGPPGSGKTLLAQCIAGELFLPLMKVAGPELVGGVSGESEERIRSLFDQAMLVSPCVLFIDEIDAISQPRESASKDMERRIVAQLLASFDELHCRMDSADLVVVIGATNRADSLDPALRRAGRFDREICVGMPDRQTRADILRILTTDVRLHPSLDLEILAQATPGYVGADLKALTTQAAYTAVNRYMKFQEESVTVSKTVKEHETINVEKLTEVEDSSKQVDNSDPVDQNPNQGSPEKVDAQEQEPENILVDECEKTSESVVDVSVVVMESRNLDNLYIENDDFMNALKLIQPSAKREGFATVPDVTWKDIGSLDHIREQLNMSIMMPVKYPEEFERLGVISSTGLLLCGPPGCGKTLLAKAVANEANINFISVKGPELLNMYVGESEKAVRQCFQRARNSQPCVIFFDEIDALCPKRDSSEGGGRAGSRVVNQLLTEMDGVEGGRGGVYMMAATNRPDMLDPAVLRPGRFDKVLYIGLPSSSDRALILKAITKNGEKPEFTSEVDLGAVGASEKCNGFTGADLSALVKEASVHALTEFIRNNRVGQLKVSNKHINSALAKIRPSVSEEERLRYEVYKVMYTPRDPSEEKMEEDD